MNLHWIILASLLAYASAEEDRSLLNKLNSNIELTKVTANPSTSSSSVTSGETLKVSETRPAAQGSQGSEYVSSSHTEQSYSSSSSFEQAPVAGSSGEYPARSASQGTSSANYQVSNEGGNYGVNSEAAAPSGYNQQNTHSSGEAYGHQSGEAYSGNVNEVDYNRDNNGYQQGQSGYASRPAHDSYEVQGQTYDLQRNPASGYGGNSGEYSQTQSNVGNQGGYSLNQDTTAYEDSNSNEDEGSAYRTQEPEGHSGAGPESQAPRKTSTLASPGPIPDYGGFRPVIKASTIPTPPIPGPPSGYSQNDAYRSVSINYESPKSIYTYDGSANSNTGSYSAKGYPIYGAHYANLNNGNNNGYAVANGQPSDYNNNQGLQQHQQQQTNYAAGYGLDYASGKPYGGDLSQKPYSADPNGKVNKVIPMTMGYDELVKTPTPSSGPHHHYQLEQPQQAEYVVTHQGPPQQGHPQVYEQQQGNYGPPQQQQHQAGPPQYQQQHNPITYKAIPIDNYEQDAGPMNYEQQQSPQSVGAYHQQQDGYKQQGHHGPQQGPLPQNPSQQGYGGPEGPRGHPQGHSGPAHYEVEPAQYGQAGPNEQYEQVEYNSGPAGKPGYEQTTTYVESDEPMNVESPRPNYGPGPIKGGPNPLTTSVEGPSSPPMESYSGNLGSEGGYDFPPSSGYSSGGYESLEAGPPPNYGTKGMSGMNGMRFNSHGFGGYSMPDESYLQSLFGFPTYDVGSPKGNPYASGSNLVPSPALPGSESGLRGPASALSSLIAPLTGNKGSSSLSSSSSSSSSPSSPSSFLPSIKLTNNGIKLTGFGSSLTGGLGSSINQAIASTLGSSLGNLGVGPSNGVGHSGHPGSSAGIGSLSSFYNGLSGSGGPAFGQHGGPQGGFGSPFNLGGNFGNYGAAASKLIPKVIRAPFRSVYRALMGGNPNPLNG